MRKPWPTLNLLYILFFKLLFLSCLIGMLACQNATNANLETKPLLKDKPIKKPPYDTSIAVMVQAIPKYHDLNIIESTQRIKKIIEQKIAPSSFKTVITDSFSLKKPVTKSVSGKKNMPFPQKIHLSGEKIPAIHNPPISVLPFSRKEEANMDVQFIDYDHHLISSDITISFQDTKGNLWIGFADAGVSKFNGLSYTHFTFEEGLGSDNVVKIVEDKNGDIWMATFRGGLCRYDGTNFTQFFVSQEIFWAHNLSDLIIDQIGNLWISTFDKGVIKFDGKELTYNLNPLIGEHSGIHSLCQDSEGAIWFFNGSNLIKHDGDSTFWNYVPEKGIEPSIPTIYQGKNGDIWLGTYDKIYRFNGEKFYLYTEINGNEIGITYMAEDNKGQLWLINNNQLFQYDGHNFKNYSSAIGLTHSIITHFFFDEENLLWVSTSGDGLLKIKENSFKHLSSIGKIPLKEVQIIKEDQQGNLLVGSSHGLIKMKNGQFTVLNEENGLNGHTISDLFIDLDNNIWVETYENGINKIQGEQITNYQSKNYSINSSFGLNMPFFQDSQKHIWTSSFLGPIYYYDQQQNYFSLNNLIYTDESNNTKITSQLEDKANHIWFCVNSRGLYRFRNNNMQIWYKDYRLNSPMDILEDKFGNIWVSTKKEGIGRFDGQTFQFLTKKEGLSSNFTNGLLEDKKGRIWVGTNNGLNLLIPKKKDEQIVDYEIRKYGRKDGLKAWNFHDDIILDRNNTLWTIDTKGLTYLDLNTFKLNDHQPTLQLDQIKIKQQHIDFRQLSDSAYVTNLPLGKVLAATITDSFPKLQNYPSQLSLPYKLNHLTFQFSAIDWEAPHQLKYSYFLEGSDDDWSLPTANNSIELRGLSHGSYILKAKAIGASQKWSKETAYTFSILPPWYYSNWAYAGYLILFLGALWWAYVLVKRRLKLQNRLAIEQQEAFRLKELDSFKSRLFTNLTHEFRTPLTVILGMSKQIIAAPKENVLEAAQLIKRNGRNLLLLVNQLLELSKLENKAYQLNLQQADISFYIRYLVESFHSYTNEHNLSLRFFSPLEQLMMDFDPHSIQQVITNLLSNAVKFTPSGGDILVQLTKEKDWLIIAVKDTGIGITPANLPHIFDRFYQADSSTTRPGEGTGIGLAHTQELVKIMGGTITVTSELGKGSHFQVRLPIHNKAMIPQTEMVYTDLALPVTALKPTANEVPISFVQSPSISANELPQLLLIEDNPDVIFYLKSCLKGLYQIRVAYNGKIGIEKALEHIPDVIISDVMMPEKDGYQVCQTLKNEERTSHIPIIILTAKVDIASRIKGLKTGADAYLSKPFNKEELLVRLEMMLELRRKLQAHFVKMTANPIAFHKNIADQLAQPSRYATENAFLQKVMANIEKELSNALFNPTRLSRAVGLSQSQLYRKIKALTNTTPALLIRKIRLDKGMILLKTTDLTVSEIAYEVGFTDPAYFSRTFSQTYGSSPNANRN